MKQHECAAVGVLEEAAFDDLRRQAYKPEGMTLLVPVVSRDVDDPRTPVVRAENGTRTTGQETVVLQKCSAPRIARVALFHARAVPMALVPRRFSSQEAPGERVTRSVRLTKLDRRGVKAAIRLRRPK